MTFRDVLAVGSSWDVSWFRLINSGLYNNWLADFTYWFARDQVILLVLLAGVFFYWQWRGWRRMVPMVAWGSLAISGTNMIHNHLLKPFFNRPRPFMILEEVHLSAALRDLSMLSSSFPSTHAASSAALATIIIKLDASCRWPALGLVAIIGFFTIYSGGHYPFDVLAGYLVGWMLGWTLMRIKQFIFPNKVKVG